MPKEAVYYNENDLKAAAWLKQLMSEGHIPRGEIDTRSIEDVQPTDIMGYEQCHFFAGIGGWAYALKLADWGDKPVWTGSCPCQPFSAAGKGKGTADERHLFPAWRWLIEKCQPPTIFGEQVASKSGRTWLASVHTDLEVLGFAVGAADLGAAGIGAPHIRQRLWFVAERMADTNNIGRRRSNETTEASQVRQGEGRQTILASRDADWKDVKWLPFTDGKARPIKPGISPVAYGIPKRVVRLRGYGNAIVPQVAAQFIKAYTETQATG